MDHLNKITDTIAANPGWWAKEFVLGVTFAFPTFVAAPILGVFGFTAGGVAAGSIAATIQSTIAPVVGAGAFATFQSAAAGGYGVALVNGVVRAVTVMMSTRGVAFAVKSFTSFLCSVFSQSQELFKRLAVAIVLLLNR